MANVISEVILKNLAFNVNDSKAMPRKVVISSILDDRYVVSIKIGDWETKITKEDLSRVI